MKVSFMVNLATACTYSWLQKNGNCQNKIETFLQFFHCVKPSYER
jgi:hypothetical protein